MRRSRCVSKAPSKFANYVMLLDAGEPSCYNEAISAHDYGKWKQVMQKELDNIYKNETWDLVPLPKVTKASV